MEGERVFSEIQDPEVEPLKSRVSSSHLNMSKPGDYDTEFPRGSRLVNAEQLESNADHSMQGKYFYYGSPHYEESGVWIPVSVPPMSESEHEEWTKGFCSNGGHLTEGDMGWSQFIREDKELTIHLLEQAWNEMAQTLTAANFGKTREILEAEPPRWLADSSAAACMLCSVRFHPIMCSRHHCRFCGGIFCNECSKGRSLLPAKFRTGDPQRVCDVCFVRLDSVQSYLMDQVSHAAQLPTHDLTDLSTLRSWVNFPWGQSMEYEIYKATNTIQGYNKAKELRFRIGIQSWITAFLNVIGQVGSLKPEKLIPDAILRQAKGLAILTIVKVGMMVTYRIGTGLVVARKEDGSWSPPSAISSFGVGWGAQVGGELTDFIIVLRTNDAVKTFSGNAHLSVGGGLSAAVGIVGRAVEADVRAGDGGFAACYTYSCSKGTSSSVNSVSCYSNSACSRNLSNLGEGEVYLCGLERAAFDSQVHLMKDSSIYTSQKREVYLCGLERAAFDSQVHLMSDSSIYTSQKRYTPLGMVQRNNCIRKKMEIISDIEKHGGIHGPSVGGGVLGRAGGGPKLISNSRMFSGMA
ncbi:SH3 domain-containing protein PJ696.02 [Vitis vinifera]|uniref:SH3 domain-containing protein PJ696.02 n=1 Tax=Vitis vinifera TaxID=29760 RepID=A0A438HH54_VITVI|nr:SH3 domain-containing protein PJ696.02 [Vitis vinifera]